jgi:hypothetical protein
VVYPTGLAVAKQAGTATVTAAAGGVEHAFPVTSRLEAAQVLTAELTTCAITTHGALACWGNNETGQFGNGETPPASTTVPTLGARGIGFTRIAPAWYHGCGLPEGLNGTLCWGAREYLGRGPLVLAIQPRGPVAVGATLDSLWAHGTSACGLTATHSLYCWGATPVPGDPTLARLVSGSYVTAGLGTYHQCALTAAGAAWCWGENAHSQLGDSSTTDSSVPVAVRGGLTFTQITGGFAHTCALTASNDAWCWGFNNAGQVGNGSVSTRVPVPVAVAGGLKFIQIGAGTNHTCALALDGAAWCWGLPFSMGSAGHGTSPVPLPAAVAGGHVFTQLTVGGDHACGLATDGRVWCWGRSANGELGVPDSPATQVAPVLVGGQ